MNGFGDREPVLPPMYLADAMAALYGYGAVMVALREVEMNGGKGQVMDLPLFDPLFSVLGPQAANHKLTGEVKKRTGSRSTNAAPRNVYRPRTATGSPVGLDPGHGRARAGQDRPARTGRGSAFRHQHRAGEERPGTRRIIGGFVGARDSPRTSKYFDEAGVTIGPVYDISPDRPRTTTCWSARR